MTNRFFHKKDELIKAINMARKNRLYSPMKGLLSNYVDFLFLLRSDESEGFHLNIVLNYEGDKPVGCIVLFVLDNGAPFVWSFVHEEFRKQGRASSMFECLQSNRERLNLERHGYNYGSPYLRKLLNEKEVQISQAS
jgi:GNAT superfamily N-acetyltransferase